jgi:hypothetical protein
MKNNKIKYVGIYKITNIINNKYYIGSAVDIKNRFKTHKRLLKNNKHFNNHLQSAYNKYGINNFTYEIIEITNKLNLLEREQYWIDILDANNNKKGYNKRLNVSSNLGISLSDETRKKLSLSHLGNKHNKDTKIKISQSQYKKVCQFNKNGEYLKTYNSFQEAAIDLNIFETGISMAVRGKIKSSGGYYWCLLENKDTFKIPQNKKKYRKHKKVEAKCLETGEILFFDSILEANKFMKIDLTTLYNKNKNSKYEWKKINP